MSVFFSSHVRNQGCACACACAGGRAAMEGAQRRARRAPRGPGTCLSSLRACLVCVQRRAPLTRPACHVPRRALFTNEGCHAQGTCDKGERAIPCDCKRAVHDRGRGGVRAVEVVLRAVHAHAAALPPLVPTPPRRRAMSVTSGVERPWPTVSMCLHLNVQGDFCFCFCFNRGCGFAPRLASWSMPSLS